MKIKDALGLSGGTDRTTVPARAWVPAGIALAAVVIVILLLTGVSAAWAVPVGLAVGLLLAVPVGAALTLRRR